MRTLLILLVFASTALAQTRTAPEQGPPPRNLTRQADGHFSANPDPANPERFEVHIVQAGETLSLIAGRVLRNPRLWPQLWEQNENIINPHWIYPKDKILIRPVTQITEAVPPEPAPPAGEVPVTPRPEPVSEQAPAVTSEPPGEDVFVLSVSRPVPEVKDDDLYCSGFVRKAAVPRDLIVLSKFETTSSVLAVESDYVYISQGAEDGIAVSDLYQVVRPTITITNPKGRTKEERDLGMHYLEVAHLRVIMAQPGFSMARITRICGEPVEVGDIILPLQPIQFPTLRRPRPFSPLMKVAGDVKGTVVITKLPLLNFGSALKGSGSIPGVRGSHLDSLARGIATEGTILYIDVGQGQGVEPGDLFIVYREVKLETTLYSPPKEASKLKGFKTAIGELVVLKVEERASTALVTYASDGISLGDAVERR